MFDRVVSDPQILGGKPVIRGTRISVELILEWLAGGATPQQIVEEYDHLTVEDVQDALRYAAASVHNDLVLRTRIAS